MDLTHTAVFGVAGNFTGHLEQAGEASDFVAVKASWGRPKGMFPIYLPIHGHRLGTWPFSDEELALPATDADVQPEPEVAFRCTISYDKRGVTGIEPTAFAAFDDTSIRRPPAPKISLKKNWGPCSKGVSSEWLSLDRFDASGTLNHHRLTCFLMREGACIAYGEDSAIRDYSTIYGDLLGWMTDKLRSQHDHGPLEDLNALINLAGRPTEMILSIGATRYTDIGTGNFVRPGDEVVIVVYDELEWTPARVAHAVNRGAHALEHASMLRRTVQ